MRNLLLIAIFTMILNGLAVAQTAKREYPYEKIARLRTQIEILLQKNETKKALQYLDELKDDEIRKESEFYLIKAEVFLKEKNFEQANEYFQSAFDFEMLDFFIQYNLCRSSFASMFENTFMSCDLAINSYKKLARINVKRQQELEKADAVQFMLPFNLKRSEELKPMFEDILLWRGSAYLDTKNYERAVEFLTLAIKQDPTKFLAHKLRAKAYRGLGKNDLAEADERKANDLHE
jgi:Tfp pilus assembly protein PilF